MKLGAFALDAVVGRGGVADVWKATHRASATAVAIKVLTAAPARERNFRARFLREVRALAQLEHPSIVRVFDFGQVSRDAAMASGGLLTVKSPWVAMELADGDLDEWTASSWPELRRALETVLEALGHAHARGVVHRDLKPGNILRIGEPEDGRLLLTDFGIAHMLADSSFIARTTREEEVAGTPAYMAPEQITGQFRDHGSWTDLYAVGCLAYTMATGRPPFDGEHALDVVARQLTEPPPPFAPQFAVPDGLDGWIHRLLHKSPVDRFSSAARAGWALRRLDEPEAPARLPEVWHEAGRPTGHLAGVGLRLVGIRRELVTGRAHEREALWTMLRRAEAGEPIQVAVLEGRAGQRAGRIARWLGERGRELGDLEFLAVTHRPRPGAQDGLGAMVRSLIGANGLRGESVGRRALAWAKLWAPHWVEEAPRLAAIAEWSPGQTADADPFESPDERHDFLVRLVADVASRRPVLLWIGDAQWGRDSVDFARRLLSGAPKRVLVVLTVESAPAETDELALGAIARLRTNLSVESRRLESLEPQQYREILSDLIDLEPSLGAVLQAHTGDDLTFARGLLTEWVEQEHLEPGPHGFRLKVPFEDAFAPDPGSLAMRRLRRALGDDEQALATLEAVAVLGGRAEIQVLEEVCHAAGIMPPPDLAGRLLVSGLVETSDSTWSLAHDAVRQGLLERARAQARWARLNQVCALVLAAHGTAESRLARYHLEAGDAIAAALQLEAAAAAYLQAGDFGQVLPVVDLFHEAGERLGWSESHPRRVAADLLRVRALRFCIGMDAARTLCSEIAARVVSPPPALAARLALARAMTAPEGASLQAQFDLHEEARQAFAGVGEIAGIVQCLVAQTWLQLYQGKLDAALRRGQHAADLARVEQLDAELGWSAQAVALIKALVGDRSGLEDVQVAFTAFSRVGAHGGMAYAHLSAGELYLWQRDYDSAEKHLRRSVSIWQAQDARIQAIAWLGLAAVAIWRGQPIEGLAILSGFDRQTMDAVSFPGPALLRLHALSVLALVATGDLPGADEAMVAVEACAEEGQLPHPDVIRALGAVLTQDAAEALHARCTALLDRWPQPAQARG